MNRISPRRWNSLVLTAAAISLAGPVAAQIKPPTLPMPSWAAPQPDAPLWQVAEGGEGGEGGEAGAVADAAPDVAYLGQLAIVEGHLLAARDLYAKGLVDEAIGLSYHPEAEMMDAVRESLTAHDVPDITPAMQAFSAALEAGAALDVVEAKLTNLRAAIAAATAPAQGELRVRFDAIVLLLKAAADEYEGSIEGGAVTDVMAYHEAHAFVQTAGLWLADLAKSDAAKVAAGKAIAALPSADEAFGDMSGAALKAGDASILAALAARVELYASAVR